MNFYIIRHGESIGNTQRGFISGRIDNRGLTIKGKNQIIRLAWQLRNIAFQQILTSPVVRAKETSTILSNMLNVTQKTQKFLNELDHGLAEGQYWWKVRQYFPKSRGIKDWHEDFDSSYTQGESFQMLSNRVWRGYERLVTKSQDANIILVTHQAVIATLAYCHLYGKPEDNPDNYLDFVHSMSTASGTIIKMLEKHGQPYLEKRGLFAPMVPTCETMKFYVSGTLALNKDSLTLKKISTASQNRDFYLHNKESYLVKVVNPHQTKTSARLIKLYAYLKDMVIPAPHIVSFDDSGVFFKHPLIIQDFQEGTEEYMCLKNHLSHQPSLQKQVYGVVKKIHSIANNEVRNYWFPDDWHKNYLSWNKKQGDLYLDEQLHLTINKLQKMPQNKNVFEKTIQKLDELQSYVQSERYRLVPLHGDLAPQNLVVSHKSGTCRLVRVLDFERARVGDPLWDLVYYYGWLQRTDVDVAQIWKNIFWNNLSQEQKKHFDLYLVLFHAWTVRDGIEYTNNRQRQLLAKKSLGILQNRMFINNSIS